MKSIRILTLAFTVATLSACGLQGTDKEEEPAMEQAERPPEPVVRGGYDDDGVAARAEARLVDGEVSLDLPQGVTTETLGDRTPTMLAVQVMLDRTAHAPGVIDGFDGGNTDRAIRYYREAHGMAPDGGADSELLEALFEDVGGDVFRTYTITAEDARGPYRAVPEEFADMAKLDALGYESPLEMLAERFHMDQEFLEALNPDADFDKAGTKLVIVSHGGGEIDGAIARIEVRKGEGSLVAFDDAGAIVASFPASIGSAQFPSPNGTMEVNTVAPRPNYTFKGDEQDWGPDGTYILQPGPNNPVGGTWIDLTKDGYGIHGTPEPDFIAKGGSHGCVRLTNWNAAALGRVIEKGVTVRFV